MFYIFFSLSVHLLDLIYQRPSKSRLQGIALCDNDRLLKFFMFCNSFYLLYLKNKVYIKKMSVKILDR